MRSFTWTLILTALFSPIFVLSSEYEEESNPRHPHQPNYEAFSSENSGDQNSEFSSKKRVRIEIKVDTKVKYSGSACQDKTDKECRERQKCGTQGDSCNSAPACDDKTEKKCRERQKCGTQGDSCNSRSKCDDETDEECREGQECGTQGDSCNSVNINLYGFRCGDRFYDQIEILRAAKAACPLIRKDEQNRIFPAAYAASDFATPGPYIEWPISRNGRWWNKMRRSGQRIVMTMDCAVVGAVIRKWDRSYKQCTYEPM